MLRSEDNDREEGVEEDKWGGGVEFGESVGVDIINRWLGYY